MDLYHCITFIPQCMFLQFSLFFNRGRLETNAEQWSNLLKTLKDLIEWTIQKDEEIHRQQPVGGDLNSVRKQAEVHQVFTTLLLYENYCRVTTQISVSCSTLSTGEEEREISQMPPWPS